METIKLILQLVGAVTIISGIGLMIIYECFLHTMPQEDELTDITIDDLIN